MNLNNFGGIPAHPLLVHIPVVLVPLVLITVLIASLKPSWHKTFAIPTAALSVVVFIGSYFAKESGEHLEELLDEKESLLEKHINYGDKFMLIALVLLLVVVIWSLYGKYFKSSAQKIFNSNVIRIIVCVVAVLYLAFASYFVYLTGHSGAKSVWNETSTEKTSGGERGE
ncbi:MAG: DUF2231 domain-containing protein [Acidimicrobiia bacterium]